MTLAFPILLIISAGLTMPAWLYARKHRRESAWMLLLPMPALVLWVGLSAVGVGPQSLSNLVEVPILVGLAIALYYLQVFVTDRVTSAPRLTTAAIVALTMLSAVFLRLFMPLLPE